MARQFPRFLYSNPTNTNPPGPFVIHCLEPRIIFRVFVDEQDPRRALPWQPSLWGGFFGVQLIDDGSKLDQDALQKLMEEVIVWIEQQIDAKDIVLPRPNRRL
jgi:hypothetical protein